MIEIPRFCSVPAASKGAPDAARLHGAGGAVFEEATAPIERLEVRRVSLNP
jgi:hypothetical protein